MRSLIFVAVMGMMAGTAAAAGETIQVNSSFNAQIFVANESEVQDQERKLKQSMYERATRECELLRASIARTCRMTGISVSTQFTPSHDSPPAFYINANVNMEVTLK